jgi:hypothetical protein
MSLPANPNVRLTRREAADALCAAGYRIKSGTLATLAARGLGPPYRIFGGRAHYRWDELLGWAEARDTEPRAGQHECHEAA